MSRLDCVMKKYCWGKVVHRYKSTEYNALESDRVAFSAVIGGQPVVFWCSRELGRINPCYAISVNCLTIKDYILFFAEQ